MKCPACGARISRRAVSCSACGQYLEAYVAELRIRKIHEFENRATKVFESRARWNRRMAYWYVLVLFYVGGAALILLLTATLQNGLTLLLFIVLVFLGWLVRLKWIESMG